jgi:hypothetical protein
MVSSGEIFCGHGLAWGRGCYKNYFDKREKLTTFTANEKALLWDSTHADKGKHTKFHKLWLGPYIISYVIGNNSYLLKDTSG